MASDDGRPGTSGASGGEGGRERPQLLTASAKAVLVVWCAVTLVLVVTYAIVLLLV